MKKWIGIILIAIGAVVGLWVGVWFCFIGGIVNAINIIKAPGIAESLPVAVQIARVALAGLAGWVSAVIFVIPGVALLRS